MGRNGASIAWGQEASSAVMDVEGPGCCLFSRSPRDLRKEGGRTLLPSKPQERHHPSLRESEICDLQQGLWSSTINLIYSWCVTLEKGKDRAGLRGGSPDASPSPIWTLP